MYSDPIITYRVSHNFYSLHFVLVVFSASCSCIEDYVTNIHEIMIPKLTLFTFLPMSKIDQVPQQNVRQIGFRYYPNFLAIE